MTHDELKKHPAYFVVLDFTRELKAAETRCRNRLVSMGFFRHENKGKGCETEVVRPLLEEYYAYGLKLTSSRVKRIEENRPTALDLKALEDDMNNIINNPSFGIQPMLEEAAKFI